MSWRESRSRWSPGRGVCALKHGEETALRQFTTPIREGSNMILRSIRAMLVAWVWAAPVVRAQCPPPPPATLTATNPAANDSFGLSVSVRNELAAVGAPGDDGAGMSSYGILRHSSRFIAGQCIQFGRTVSICAWAWDDQPNGWGAKNSDRGAPNDATTDARLPADLSAGRRTGRHLQRSDRRRLLASSSSATLSLLRATNPVPWRWPTWMGTSSPTSS